MTSADSDMLAAGSIFSNDLYAQMIRKQASDKEILLVTCINMVVIGLLVMAVALTNTKSMITMLMFSFTLRAGGAFFPYVLGHYWRKAGPGGTIASILLGSLTVLFVDRGLIPFWGMEPILPGLLVSLTAWVGLSLVFPNQRDTTNLAPTA